MPEPDTHTHTDRERLTVNQEQVNCALDITNHIRTDVEIIGIEIEKKRSQKL